eukprot:c236_g1_i1 orf=213-1244(-)
MATSERRSDSLGEPNTLLKDLHEKKQNLRRIANEVGSMAFELRDVRSRMAAQEASLAQETARRQSAESKARSVERELELLQKNLEERNSQALHSTSVAEQYLQELVDVRAKLEAGQTAADSSATVGNTVHLQCTNLLKEIEKKYELLQEREKFITRLGQQLTELQHDMKQREISQKQSRDEVERFQAEMKMALAKTSANKDGEFKKLMEDFSAKNVEQFAKHLSAKDDEIARVREEIKLASAQLKFKTQDLEAQLEKQRKADQELKKRVIKLEFWLQDARSQTRKLQRIAERREKEIKDLRAQLWLKEADSITPKAKSRLWDGSRFKILLSVSVVALLFLARR